ncbi:MAG TPA: hypothetical protein VI451_13715 [Anaerolineales bacterium]|nr:hypothetical protein [Anaerolineales bacterium]
MTLRKKIPFWSVPIALFVVCIGTFGLLTPDLGFFQDDWPILNYQMLGGTPGLWELHLHQSRPFAMWVYQLAFSLIGGKRLLWQLLTLTLRALTVWVMWQALVEIWPMHKRQATMAALLFAVYPLFLLQPLAVTFLIHWFGYLIYAISLWAMARAFREPGKFWGYLLLAVIASGLHMFSVEYYVGLELARPLILWFLIDNNLPPRKRLQTVMKCWAPFAGMLIFFASYRVYWMPRPSEGFDQNPPQMLFDLLQSPVSILFELVKIAFKDGVQILVSVWGNVFTPASWDLSRPAHLLAFGIAFVIGIGAYVYLRFLRVQEPEPGEDSPAPKQMLLLGTALTLLGPLPAWITYQTITANNPLWSNRFGLGSMIGAVLVVVALLEIAVLLKYRTPILCALLTFTAAFHLLYTNDYRWSATKQSLFYYQLSWRAPYIEPGTAILSDGEIFNYMGEYPTSFALGILYQKPDDVPQNPKYWFFGLNKHFETDFEELVEGKQISSRTYTANFTGDSHQSLVIYFEPEKDQCLWVLNPDDYEIQALPRITRDVMTISNLSTIHAEASHPPDPDIFGPELPHIWCYYYQKADLARQFEDWEQIPALWKQAKQQGYKPANGVEYLPFIKGFAHTGDWEMAEKLTADAKVFAQGINPQLCLTWVQLENEIPFSEARDTALSAIREKLNCLNND